MMGWTSLKKELPPLGEWVLGLTDMGAIAQIRRVNADANCKLQTITDWMIPAWLKDDAKFTHWIPIPEIPQD